VITGRTDERIVVLAPTARDGPLTAEFLAKVGFECVVARDMDDLCRLVQGGAAAVFVAEEALAPPATAALAALLARQEPWSDLPVVIFVGKGARIGVATPTLDTLAPYGNVTLIERPVQIITLLSAARAALRARRRQYAARGVLADLLAAQQELRGSEARFRTMADETPVMIWVTDAAARIEFVNRAYCEFFGTSLEAVQSGGWHPLVHPDDAPAYVAAFTTALAGRKPFRSQARVRRADGEWRWVESYGSPRLSETGEFLGMAGSSPDVTDRKLGEEALRESDRRKTEFLGLLSHELRNPLAPIRNGIDLLERAPPGGEQARRAIEVMKRQTGHLTRIVDDLLDVTRIERGKIELQRAVVDVREVVRRTCEDHRSLLDARGVELVVETSVPAWVDADATRLAQIFGNLLQNATKFTRESGHVHVSVTVAESRAEIRVRDDGIGIPPELLPRLFTPFVQANFGIARARGGLGLGLALVKGLVELHGGSVRASSGGRDSGTEFVVSLPLAEAAERGVPRARPSAPIATVDVLVIDDNVDAAQTIAQALELAGHRVHVATDGRSGLEKARSLRPDVIVCDIGLPDIDGYEIARTLRRDETLRAVRLVALSGYAQPDDRRQASDAGFDVHLAKPSSIEALLASLSS
jgi:two-component system CheB/CheR fusion protein